MKITAITRYKNGEIYTLLKQLGWSQNDLARKAGLSPSQVGNMINFSVIPTDETKRKIRVAFAEEGIFLDEEKAWPRELPKLKRSLVVEETREIENAQLAFEDHLQLNAPDQKYSIDDLTDIKYYLQHIAPVDRDCLIRYYYNGETYAEIAKHYGVHLETIRKRVNDTLMYLRRVMESEDKYPDIKINPPRELADSCSEVLERRYGNKEKHEYTKAIKTN